MALAFALPQLWRPIPWRVDSFFYQAQVLELRGHDARQARRDTFASLADARRDDAELDYEARFYRRRWSVPAIAAVIYGVVGIRSLQIVSLAGYVLCGILLYVLLRRWRFTGAASAVVAIACLALPTLRLRGARPLTDTFGLALEIGGLILGWLALRNDRRWIVPWVAALALLSVTRDSAVIPLAAVAWIVVLERSTRAALIALTGVAAALPALFLFETPLRENLAFTFNGFAIPPDASWSFILHHYPAAARLMLKSELIYLGHHPVTAVLYVGGLVTLFARGWDSRALTSYARAGAVAAAAFVYVIPQYSSFRLELVLLPFVAIGLAPHAERGWALLATRVRARAP